MIGRERSAERALKESLSREQMTKCPADYSRCVSNRMGSSCYLDCVVSKQSRAVKSLTEAHIPSSLAPTPSLTTMDNQKRSDWKTVDLQWTPDVDPVSVDEVMKPTRDSTAEQQMIAKMWVMCAIEMQDKLRVATCTKPHFERYRSWLAAEYERFKQPGYPQVPDSRELVAMSSEARLNAMTELRDRVKDTYMWPVIEGPWRVYDNVVNIVEGRIKLVKVLLKDGLLEKFYDWANGLSEVRPMFNLMGRSNPRLRIIEIGAGTGDRLYRSYVFNDFSPLFFDSARQRFEAYDNIEYRALDISRDPREQGIEAGAYDLVIASNVSIEKFLLCFFAVVKKTVAV